MSRRGLILLGIFLTIHCTFPKVSADHRTSSYAGDNRSVALNTSTNKLQTTSNNDEGHDNHRGILVSILRTPLVLFCRLLVWGLTGIIRNITAMQRPLMNLAGRIVSNISEAALVEGWKLTKNFMLPKLDEFAVTLARQGALPEGLTATIVSMHSLYGMLKILGFL